MMEWQDISTAPRTGEEVIILVGSRDVFPKVMSAIWYKGTTEMGWWDARHHYFTDEDLAGWLPLPHPPTGERG